MTQRSERRPDPDALLALHSQGRGRLTVFLGAAPGVGKTFAMLSRARAAKASGTDIVIGLAETHGRSETAALLDGLEVLPRRTLEYQGRALSEFDIDAALLRKPAIIVVDEMAHTNVQGSRHPKRHQDIDELLTAGIDVWTALNIQHLESLSDLVSRIAGIEVREIVPDVALKRADDVVLVDLPPAELIDRLKAGKVYLPENAQRAIDGFFKPQTLTALRELALRRTADRVDDQMVDILRQSAIEGPWATAERLLVLVGPDPLSEKVVRTASRLASGLNAPWLVISIAKPGTAMEPAAARRLETTLRLAERLGGKTRQIVGTDFVDEILRVGRKENITQIVVGRPKRSLLERLTKPSLPDTLVRRSRDIGVHVVAGEPNRAQRPGLSLRGRTARDWIEILALPVIAVAVITLVGVALNAALPLENISMLYLGAVVLCGVVSGRLSAIVAAALSFLAYDFFLIDPVFTFSISKPHELFALVVFLAAAIVTGDMTGRLREQAERSRRQEEATQALYEFSRKLGRAARLDTVLDATAAHLFEATGMGSIILIPEGGDLAVGTAWPPDLTLDTAEMTAARWARDKREAAGHATATLPQLRWLFRPMTQGTTVVAVLGLLRDGADGALLAHEEQVIRGVIEQATIAIDRARLARENARTSALEEGERLHAALFASLSHDLKTPLASISGAVSSLKELGDRMDRATRHDLLTAIEEEASRLSRFVANLFDMTRIEAGTLRPRLEELDVSEVVADAVGRTKRLHPAHAFELSLADALPSVRADPQLLGQVLFNLLDNACKYGGEAPVTVFARTEGDKVVIAVTDQGKGIPEGELERIFHKFYRRTKGDGRAAGTGLGLSIARGFVEGMGGTLKAESPAIRKRGTRFTVRLPAASATAQ